MSNMVEFSLDVLAGSPAENNQIEVALKEPCHELICWVADRVGQRPEEVAPTLKKLVAFEPGINLSARDSSVNKANRFTNAFNDRWWGTVNEPYHERIGEVPDCCFFLTYWDNQASYAGKVVIRAGEEIREVFDGNQRSQALEWVLPKIFAPYRAEHDLGLEFGSLWGQWESELVRGVRELQSSAGSSHRLRSPFEYPDVSERAL